MTFHSSPSLTRVLFHAAIGYTLYALSPAFAEARTFSAEGSDTGMGVGPRYIALGGSGVAISDDVYAAYHNPAGLAEVKSTEVTISRQLNAELRPINFFGIAVPLPLQPSWGYKAAVAGVYYPRIHAHSEGAFNENEFESIFLRYLLPDMSGTFDGVLDSKTKVYRLAFGLAPSDSDRWSAGFNLDHVDCKSNFCGVHATSNGYTMSSTGATAFAYGAGFKYRPSSALTLAGAVTDANTKLNVNVVTTDAAGTHNSSFTARFPRKISAGMAYRYSPSTLMTGSYEITKGKYGSNGMDVQILRFGTEMIYSDSITHRYGLTALLKIHSDSAQDISLPFPVAPAAGVGWRHRAVSVDLTIYTHPIMSVYKNRLAPAADLTISARF